MAGWLLVCGRPPGWVGWHRPPCCYGHPTCRPPETETPCRLLAGTYIRPSGRQVIPSLQQPQELEPLLAGLDLPETYILYHGPAADEDLRRLFRARPGAGRQVQSGTR